MGSHPSPDAAAATLPLRPVPSGDPALRPVTPIRLLNKMNSTAFALVGVLFMLAIGVSLIAWPRSFQDVAIRYSDKSFLNRAADGFVRSDGYVGMLRVLGGAFVLVAIFVAFVLIVTQGQ